MAPEKRIVLYWNSQKGSRGHGLTHVSLRIRIATTTRGRDSTFKCYFREVDASPLRGMRRL